MMYGTKDRYLKGLERYLKRYTSLSPDERDAFAAEIAEHIECAVSENRNEKEALAELGPYQTVCAGLPRKKRGKLKALILRPAVFTLQLIGFFGIVFFVAELLFPTGTGLFVLPDDTLVLIANSTAKALGGTDILGGFFVWIVGLVAALAVAVSLWLKRAI